MIAMFGTIIGEGGKLPTWRVSTGLCLTQCTQELLNTLSRVRADTLAHYNSPAFAILFLVAPTLAKLRFIASCHIPSRHVGPCYILSHPSNCNAKQGLDRTITTLGPSPH
jgi:hypothetical protein